MVHESCGLLRSISKPLVREFGRVEEFELFFGGGVFSFFLSEEDVLEVELLHVEELSGLLVDRRLLLLG